VELVVGSTNLLVNTIGEMTTDVFTDLVIPSSVTNYDGGTVTVKWTCQDIDSSACKSSSTGATLVIADGNTLNITKGELAGGMSYTITATASEGTRTTTSSTKVTVANEKTAAVLAHVYPAGSVQNNAPVTCPWMPHQLTLLPLCPTSGRTTPHLPRPQLIRFQSCQRSPTRCSTLRNHATSGQPARTSSF